MANKKVNNEQKNTPFTKKKEINKDKTKETDKAASVKHSDLKKAETVKAEKVEKEGSSKPSTKYHFSINLSSNKPEKTTNNTETKPSSLSRIPQPKSTTPKKDVAQTHFTKEAETVRIAETAKPKEVKHIKYSEQGKNKVALGSVLEGANAAKAKPSSHLEKLKNSIDQIKSDSKSFKELQTFVRPSLLDKTKKALAKRVSLKYWTYTLMGIMKAVDLFISFVIMPRGEGRNPSLQKARSPILFGLWVFFIFFIIGGSWAGFAPLDKSAGGQGYIVTASKKQVIQHKEVGVIEAIYVKEGDSVKAAQPLVKLDDTQIKIQLEAFYSQKKEFEKLLQTATEQVLAMKELAEKGFIAKFKVTEQEAQEAKYRSQLTETNAKIATYEEILEKSVIKSPLNGIVTQINITTIGGTVSPGQTIMTVTPSQEDLILEAYISAKDIESVHVGLKAKVMVTAFISKSTSYIEGIVTYISPNAVTQQQGPITSENIFLQRAAQGGGVFYKVRISIDKKQLKKISKLKDYQLTPGMEAQVQIAIGERTLIQYLLDPILMTFWHAFKEK